MKYLKKFNENNNKEELIKFCNDYLSYLLDDDAFEYKIEQPAPIFEISYEITLKRKDNDKFEWDDIKDYFIPFTNVLNDEFYLIEIIFYKDYAKPSYGTGIKTKNSDTIDIDSILNDSLTEKEKEYITEITLTLNDKFKRA